MVKINDYFYMYEYTSRQKVQLRQYKYMSLYKCTRKLNVCIRAAFSFNTVMCVRYRVTGTCEAIRSQMVILRKMRTKHYVMSYMTVQFNTKCISSYVLCFYELIL